jgi:hypothetical protein
MCGALAIAESRGWAQHVQRTKLLTLVNESPDKVGVTPSSWVGQGFPCQTSGPEKAGAETQAQHIHCMYTTLALHSVALTNWFLQQGSCAAVQGLHSCIPGADALSLPSSV